MIEPILRFMVKFDLGSVPVHNPDLGQCWEWNAGKNHQGYAKFRDGGRGSNTVPGHCFSYNYFIGSVPTGLQLDHLCNNKSCVNPWHLKPVTGSENVFRASHRHRAKTHCAKGHEFTEENTWLSGPSKYGRFQRKCRTCHRIHSRNWSRLLKGQPEDYSERLRESPGNLETPQNQENDRML